MKKLFTTLIFTLLTLLSFSQLIYNTQTNGTFTQWNMTPSGQAGLNNSNINSNGYFFEFIGLYNENFICDITKKFSYSTDTYFIGYDNNISIEVAYSTYNNQVINGLEIYTSEDNGTTWTMVGSKIPVNNNSINTFNISLSTTTFTWIRVSVVGHIFSSPGGFNKFTIKYIKLLGTTTSIEDFTDNNIKIYTYNKQLFIKDIDSDIDGNSKVLIYNISGQIIKETIIKDVIDLSIDNGLYIVVIKDKSGNIIKSKKVYIL